MRAKRLVAATVLLVLTALPAAGDAAVPAGFVQRDGEHLVVDGEPWRAIGVNLWDMDAGRVLAGDVAGCWYTHADLDEYFDQSFARIAANTGATAVRTFGFRAMYTAGGRDWSSIDKLLFYARKHGVRVIPVFGDQYGTCGGGSPRGPSWYRDGYRTIVEQPWGVDYRSYVVEAVRRYRDDPTIAFWQLMNEATAGSDTDALRVFSHDMVRAIRDEAGDHHHLVNLGTTGGGEPGNALPAYAELLACGPSSGGCNDLAEAHVFNIDQPLPGLPLPSFVSATLRVWNTAGDSHVSSVTEPTIDGWTRMKLTVPASSSGQPFTRWSLQLGVPEGGAFGAFLDEVVQTSATPRVYTFDTGTEGFTAEGAALSHASTPARGLGALRIDLPAAQAPRLASVIAPDAGGALSSIELDLRVNFRAPGPETGASIAADLHAATVSREAPFFLGEVGFQVARADLPRCAEHRSVEERRAMLDRIAREIFTDERAADGLLIWDWKDPSILSTTAGGQRVPDPTVDCWTVSPGDPAEGVLAAWADQVAPAPLPAGPALPAFDPYLTVLAGPEPVVGDGHRVRYRARLTRGGDAIAGADVVAGGGCAGTGTTDGRGLADFECTVDGRGPMTFTLGVDPASCDCEVEAAKFPVEVKRGVVLAAEAAIVETGDDAPLHLVIEDPSGEALTGVGWRVPECGIGGTIAASAARVEIADVCPGEEVGWTGSALLHLIVDEDADVSAVSLPFVGMTFERIFLDARAGECVGLAPSKGWVGATASPGACGDDSFGTFAGWFVHEVDRDERATAFRPVGDLMVVDADAKDGRRITGTFSWTDRRFAAAVVRPDGIHPLASA